MDSLVFFQGVAVRKEPTFVNSGALASFLSGEHTVALMCSVPLQVCAHSLGGLLPGMRAVSRAWYTWLIFYAFVG